MRVVWALLVAALFLPTVLPANGQSDAGTPVEVLTEGKGDVLVNVNGNTEPASGRFQAVDVVGLAIAETADTMTFIVKVDALQPGNDVPGVETSIYRVDFTHNDRMYRVVMVRNEITPQQLQCTTTLQAYDSGRDGYFPLTKSAAAKCDASANTISATYSKDNLVDANGNAPQPAVPFTEFHVSATSLGTNFMGGSQGLCTPFGGVCSGPLPQVQANDAMPDQGTGAIPYKPLFGIVQTGHARLSSPIPTRASNGEATTIVYKVTAQNIGNSEELFMLGASGTPKGWEVQLPAEHITIKANSSVPFPVLVTIPFSHSHGVYQFFLLSMTSMKDSASVGRLQLGVRFSDPPQPTGHHSELWVHTVDPDNFLDQFPVVPQATDPVFGTGASLYMNAKEDDPLDTKLPVPGQPCRYQQGIQTPSGAPISYYCWNIPLSPSLELGLHFDLNKTGKITVPLTSTQPLQDATLMGALDYYPPQNITRNQRGGFGGGQGNGQNGRPTELASVKSKTVSIGAGSSTPVLLEAELKPTLSEPYIPFVKGASLVLQLQLQFTGIATGSFPQQDQTPPHIVSGAKLTDLPLFEYHDRINQLFASSSVLMLQSDTPQDRLVNPGDSVLFNLTLMNHGSKPASIDLMLKGTHVDWSQVLTPTGMQVNVPAGGTTKIAIAVRTPKDAVIDHTGAGSMADLVLSATDTSDLNQRTLARLHVMLDNTRDWPSDEATILAIQGHKEKKSPGLELPLLLAGLGALALVLRRRHAA